MGRKIVELPPVPAGADRPIVLARVHPGRRASAVELAQQDAEGLVANGYVPVGQSYAGGEYSTLTIITATVLVPFGIGVLLLLFMAAVRPPGSLAVTYTLRDAAF